MRVLQELAKKDSELAKKDSGIRDLEEKFKSNS